MYHNYIVMGDSYLETDVMEQFQISQSTSYIGFVDQDKRPCGLGCAYSNSEMYCGNFFEGVLEHYGRMVF